MSATLNTRLKLPSAYLLFQLFKYSVYCLLVINLVLFFQENTEAMRHTFTDGLTYDQLGEAFSDTIDSTSWVLLLLLFELETYVMSDRLLTAKVKAALFAARSLSYLFILYSAYGFISRYLSVLSASPYSIVDACTLVGTQFSHIVSLNDYRPINADTCLALNNQPLMRLNGTEIIGGESIYGVISNLAMVDVINSLTWVLIVVILEVDVYLQTSEHNFSAFVHMTNWIKIGLYVALLSCAIYWWIDGDFLDFWDAFLWLVAFVFIEMNLFEWQEELQQRKPSEPIT